MEARTRRLLSVPIAIGIAVLVLQLCRRRRKPGTRAGDRVIGADAVVTNANANAEHVEHGDHLPSRSIRASDDRHQQLLAPPPVAADDDEESPEYLEALDGTDTDQSTGCGAVTKPAVYDLVEPVAADAQALLNDLDARIDGYWSSDLARSTLAEWTSCMNTQGFSAESPEELAVRFAGADDVSTEELQVRLTDLDCDREVGLTQQRSTWESDRVDEWASDTAAAWADLEPRIAQVSAEITALADE